VYGINGIRAPSGSEMNLLPHSDSIQLLVSNITVFSECALFVFLYVVMRNAHQEQKVSYG
jgi:hypothetical protein